MAAELPTVSDGGRDMTRMHARGATSDPWGRMGDGPFCEETWQRPGLGVRLLVCQRGPRHVAEGRPHKDVSGLHWSDDERATGALR